MFYLFLMERELGWPGYKETKEMRVGWNKPEDKGKEDGAWEQGNKGKGCGLGQGEGGVAWGQGEGG